MERLQQFRTPLCLLLPGQEQDPELAARHDPDDPDINVERVLNIHQTSRGKRPLFHPERAVIWTRAVEMRRIEHPHYSQKHEQVSNCLR